MSFGFGPSDIINITILAWDVYKACRDSSDEFQRIAKEVKILHVTLKETEELLEEYNFDLSPSRRERLDLIRESCSENLNELQALIRKYDRLATPSQRVWDQMRFGLQDVSEIKQNITATYTKLDAFNHILSNSSQRIIIKKLDKYRNEVRAGLHEGSVVSTASLDSIDTKEAWEGLRRELETIGISKTVINENQDFITGWFRESFARGELEEETPLDLTETTSITSPPSVLSGTTAVTHPTSLLSASTTVVDSSSTSFQFSNPFDKYFETIQPTISSESSTTRKSSGGSSSRKKSRIGSLMFKVFRSDALLLEAASDGNADRVADLIRKGANINVKDRWGWAPMSMAAYGGYADIAKLLIEAGADLDYQDVDGDTPLDLATNKGHTPVVLLLQEEMTRRTVENG